jgi:lipopolysaccharide/colanic/teichoic acid biosynthesis glycosyltransferase
LLVVADWEDEVGRHAVVGEDDGHVIMTFFDEPLQCPLNRVLKRLFDLAVSIPAVLFVLPVTALAVWLAQRAQAPGPLFFRQKRSGANGRLFEIYKFRTMHVGNPDETRQASVDDPRIFGFGRWLRKMSLDELPQFINVLEGDMSVIGPRPHLPAHDEIFSPAARWYRARQLVKPGITGLAQVQGFRGETKCNDDVKGRIEADLQYLERWSFPMDCIILLRTIWQVIAPPKSAY